MPKQFKVIALVTLIIAGLGWSAFVLFGNRTSEVVIVSTGGPDQFRAAANAAIFGNEAEKWTFERVSVGMSADGATVIVSGRVNAAESIEEIKKRLAAIQPTVPFRIDVKVGN